MNRKQAADYLGKSEKTVSRAVADGRLKAERLPTGELEISEEELQRFQAASETLLPVQAKQEPEGETGHDTAALVRVPAIQRHRQNSGLTLETLAMAVVAIADNLEARDAETGQDTVRVPVSDKLLLTLEEAHLLSGLSTDRLKKGIKEGDLKARKEGRGWKMRRADLEAFVDSLFDGE